MCATIVYVLLQVLIEEDYILIHAHRSCQETAPHALKTFGLLTWVSEPLSEGVGVIGVNFKPSGLENIVAPPWYVATILKRSFSGQLGFLSMKTVPGSMYPPAPRMMLFSA